MFPFDDARNARKYAWSRVVRKVIERTDIDNDNDNENMFITTDIYSINKTNARHKYIGKSIKQ